jgi:Flp pilus assembly protein TadD
MAHCDAGRPAEAIHHFGRAADLDPTSAEFRLALGQTQWTLGQCEGACQAFLAATQAKPDFAKALNALGVAQMTLGQTTNAETSLRKAVVVQTDYLAAWNNLGTLLQKDGRTSEAIECFRRVVAHDRNFANAQACLDALERSNESRTSLSNRLPGTFRVDAPHEHGGRGLASLDRTAGQR